MKVRWLGHAAFLITAKDGTRIITDPYETGFISYKPITEEADVVTVSHEHGDHNNDRGVNGNPTVLRGAKTQKVKGIEFKGIATYHDSSKGGQRGTNTIFCFDVDGVRFAHLGDLGHPLTDAQIADMGKVDVLLAVTGGGPTIDMPDLMALIEKLGPKVVFPMHYKNDKAGYPRYGVDDFVAKHGNARRVNSAETDVTKESLPAKREAVVLQSTH